MILIIITTVARKKKPLIQGFFLISWRMMLPNHAWNILYYGIRHNESGLCAAKTV